MSQSDFTLRMIIMFVLAYTPLWIPILVSGVGWLTDTVRDRRELATVAQANAHRQSSPEVRVASVAESFAG